MLTISLLFSFGSNSCTPDIVYFIDGAAIRRYYAPALEQGANFLEKDVECMNEDTVNEQAESTADHHKPGNPAETNNELEKRQRRLPKGSVPPALNLEEAIDIARKIHAMPGGEAPYSAAPDITGNSEKSSVFGKRLMALRDFGVAVFDEKKKIVSITELGQTIVAPRDEDEHLKALARSFLSIDLFAKIYEKIRGRALPQDTYLTNSISDYVPRELAETWLDRLKRSLKTAHLLDDSRPDGKVYVLDKPQLIQAAKPSEEAPRVKDEKQDQPEASNKHAEPIRTPIPLGPGRLAYIELPHNWKPTELKKLLKMLELALGDDEGVSA